MKTIKIFLLILIAMPLSAQVQDTEGAEADPKAQQRIKAAQAAYITERLGLTPEEAEKFWPVYREYAEKRREIRQQMRDARKGGHNEKELIDLDLRVKQQELDLEKDYSGRLQKIIPPQKLMNLRQAEVDFRRLLLRQLQQRQEQSERLHRQRERSQERLRQRNN